MAERIIDRKTWHEVITDEMDWVLVELAAWKLVEECVALDDPVPIELFRTDFREYCHAIISTEHFPDDLSFNQVVAILNNYLQNRWEGYKNRWEDYKNGSN